VVELLCVYCDVGTEFLYVLLMIIMHVRAKCNLYDVFTTKAAQRMFNFTILQVAEEGLG
jgi:hypothetical protein